MVSVGDGSNNWHNGNAWYNPEIAFSLGGGIIGNGYYRDPMNQLGLPTTPVTGAGMRCFYFFVSIVFCCIGFY